MRLWSIHPKYLDAKGLTAEWKEGIQGLYALKRSIIEPENKKIMFINHPQLARFKRTGNPIGYLTLFLSFVLEESKKRNYLFNGGLLGEIPPAFFTGGFDTVSVTKGQILYEARLLEYKLENERKKPASGKEHLDFENIELHPLFHAVPGFVEAWERQRAEITERILTVKDSKIKRTEKLE